LLAAAALVAVAGVFGAAVLHGVFNGKERTIEAVQRAAPSSGKALGTAPRDATSSAGGAFERSASPSLGGNARLRRYEASLRIRVDGENNLSRATARATRIATALGGYAASVQYRTPAGRPGQSFLELRIPTARVQAALTRLGELGTILSQRISVQDLQRDLERQTAQIAQLRRTVHLILDALKDPGITPVQRVQLQVKLAEAKRALAQRAHARKTTIAEGTLARVSLVLTAAKPAAAAPHDEGRVDRMLGSAAGFLGLEALIALYVLVVASPVILLLLLGWGGARAWRRRDEKRLLTT
jgi:hypothetical protein